MNDSLAGRYVMAADERRGRSMSIRHYGAIVFGSIGIALVLYSTYERSGAASR